MGISEQDIEKFKQLYRSHFGKELTNEEAYEKASKLLRLVEIIYRPIPEP